MEARRLRQGTVLNKSQACQSVVQRQGHFDRLTVMRVVNPGDIAFKSVIVLPEKQVHYRNTLYRAVEPIHNYLHP